MIQRLDDMLIDGMFQPVADRLAWLTSPYQIAKFLVTGFLLGQCIDTVWDGWLPWLSPLRLVSCLFVVWQAFQSADRAQKHADSRRAMTANPERASAVDAFRRLAIVIIWGFVPSMLAVSAHYTDPRDDSVIYAGSCWLYVASAFFLACNSNPPTKFQHSPAFLTR